MAPGRELSDTRSLVISGPSGVGKGTLRRMLAETYPRTFTDTISHTTRPARPGEIDGVAYHFVSKSEFLSMIEENRFVEHTIFSGNHYGTSKQTIAEQSSAGRVVLVEIEMNGVKQIKADPSIDARYVFIAPPSLQTLELRLRERGTESDAKIEERLAQARLELEYAETSGAHDLTIINDDLHQAYKELEDFVFNPTPRKT